jgi:putative transcription factor
MVEMANCEMCGKDTDLFLALIEGTELKVCAGCTRYGKVLRKAARMDTEKPLARKKIIPKEPERELIEDIRPDYPALIKGKRESLGLKQIELAKKLNERESLLHKIECGEYMPSLALARKLEKFLGLQLIEQKEVKKETLKTRSSSLTIGDMLKLK